MPLPARISRPHEVSKRLINPLYLQRWFLQQYILKEDL